jgi:hypothetical protein
MLVVSAGFAGAAVIVSGVDGAGSGSAAGAVTSVVAPSVVTPSWLLFPHDAANKPSERARTDNFKNFMIIFLDGYDLYL